MFIHGGNFVGGSAGGLQHGVIYDGQDLVNTTGSIVVTINYRLGLLGFLYTGASITGNYGLMDQEMAMRWVQANIGSFGGDPRRVVLVGQSAGAMSIGVHLSRPSTAGLYSAAIMHSNPFALPFRTPASGIVLARQVALYTGCSATADFAPSAWRGVEACLRALTPMQLRTAQDAVAGGAAANILNPIQSFLPIPPTIGTAYLPRRPLVAFQAGAVQDVPIIMGTVLNESNIYVYPAFGSSPLSSFAYRLTLEAFMGSDKAAAINAQYPIPSPPPPDLVPLLAQVVTDGAFLCATRNASASLAAAKKSGARRSSTFVYQFIHPPSFASNIGTAPYCMDAVCHGIDLLTLFHPAYPQYGVTFTTKEDTLSRTMGAYWAGLAANGTVGLGSQDTPLAWPQYGTPNRFSLVFDTPNSVASRYNGPNCDFWDVIGYKL